MNTEYLMQYISRNLHTIVRKYTEDRILIEEVCLRKDLAYVELDPIKIFSCYPGSEKGTMPVLAVSPSFITYGMIPGPDFLFTVGPILLKDDAGGNFVFSDPEGAADFCKSLYRCSLVKLSEQILLLYNLYHEETRTFEEIVEFNFFKTKELTWIREKANQILSDHLEEQSLHNPYDQEQREIESIRSGNLEQLKKSWGEDYTGQLGKLARSKLRSNKNMGIVLVVLASRAAIEGGIEPELAFSLSDSYILKIEEAVNADAAVQLGRNAEYHYASLVHQRKTEKNFSKNPAPNRTVDRAKQYILAHLHGKILTSEIAQALYLTPNYLSTLFKKQEGVTVAEYVWEEKLKLVKEMLVYSRSSFDEIAALFGFCSQSHLGRRFKASTGSTLLEYREKFGQREI